jgi:hypothetical protein
MHEKGAQYLEKTRFNLPKNIFDVGSGWVESRQNDPCQTVTRIYFRFRIGIDIWKVRKCWANTQSFRSSWFSNREIERSL